MYSHKRSFTGNTSIWAALLDIPFLMTGAVVAFLSSILHSAATFYKIKEHIRPFPDALSTLSKGTLFELLQASGSLFNVKLMLSYWLGLFLPIFLTSLIVRWTLATLRVSVQRLVTVCFLSAFYFCSFMIVALHSKSWTPGNLMVQLFEPLGEGFFQSLRALLCLGMVAYAIHKYAMNATSRLDRNVRMTFAALASLGLLFLDFYSTKQLRSVDSSHLKDPHPVKFVFVLPELSPQDVRTAFEEDSLAPLKEQLTSFQEIIPSTASALGQFVTSLTGLEPPAHGIRHDYMDTDLVRNTSSTIKETLSPSGESLLVSSLGGPSPIAEMFDAAVPGKRCGQSLPNLARLGQFQASVFPYSLIPSVLETHLHPELLCSNRFLTLEQSLFHAYQHVVEHLQSKGGKTILIWLSPHLHPHVDFGELEKSEDWNGSSFFTRTLLKSHLNFLSSTQLLNHHRTFIVGLGGENHPTTAFARLDGQIKTDASQLALDVPNVSAQSSIRSLMRDTAPPPDNVSSFFYSEFADSQDRQKVLSLPLTTEESYSRGKKFLNTLHIDNALLRRTLVTSTRQIICRTQSDTAEQLTLNAVKLNFQSATSKVPQILPVLFPANEDGSDSSTDNKDLCFKEAESLLLESVFNDVTFRDTAPLKTLLAGLPLSQSKTVQAGQRAAPSEEESDGPESIAQPPYVKDKE